MTTASLRAFRKLEGLFSIYKPPGIHWKLVRDTIETNLLKGINAAPPAPPRPHVRFVAGPGCGVEGVKGLSLSAASVPSLTDHPLVSGPEFQQIRVGVGHRLDAFSSGVLVLGVGQGNKALTDLYRTPVTRDYTLEGEFGTATDNFSHTGRIIERSTYGHVTRDKLERVLAMMQGAHQKALLVHSHVDMDSQEAYELAAEGALRPDKNSPPIMIGLRCLTFDPPHFTLEVQCWNETQRYLRKILHEVGLELHSTAVCKGVRRTRDGPFTLPEALTRQHWTAPDILQAIQQYNSARKPVKHAKRTNTERPSTERPSTEKLEVDTDTDTATDTASQRQARGEEHAAVASLH